MKIGFITTAGNAFRSAFLIKDLPQVPQLGDFIEFNDDESCLLGFDSKCLLIVLERTFTVTGEFVCTVDTEENMKKLGYVQHVQELDAPKENMELDKENYIVDLSKDYRECSKGKDYSTYYQRGYVCEKDRPATDKDNVLVASAVDEKAKIEIVFGEWAVTTDGDVYCTGKDYLLSAVQIGFEGETSILSWILHLRGKEWFNEKCEHDFITAFIYSLALMDYKKQ